MDLTQIQTLQEPSSKPLNNVELQESISLEAEIPEALYMGMKSFISMNPTWDQYSLMTSAIANFLFQNGCEDRVVTEIYLKDLFTRS